MSARLDFENAADAVARARRFVAGEIAGVDPEVAAEVAIMVSELATNSVRHTATEFSVFVDRTASEIRVEVTDTGSGVPTVRSPDALEPTGRGLRIVRELADAFGIDDLPDGPGKTVWFVVALDDATGQRSQRSARAARGEPEPRPGSTSGSTRGPRARGRDSSPASPEARSRPRGMRRRHQPRRRRESQHT
jgi:anti-sigma regulatory factor (Ser/Thr protein kinase)